MAEKETKTKKAKKPSKIVSMFKNLKSEFKKITWASPKSTFKSFGIVLVGLLASAIAIGLVDWGLQSLFDFLAKHLG